MQEDDKPIIQTPLVVANWKMHGLNQKTRDTLTSIILEYGECDNVVICPPFIAMRPVGHALDNTGMYLGAQDCHFEDEGAYTGDVSAGMLYDVGVQYVIVGHSERREYHHETDEIARLKAEAAHRHRLVPIICVGESEEEREAGKTIERIKQQLHDCIPASANPLNTVIAYEPLWAIGTGKVPTAEQIEEVHTVIATFTEAKNLDAGPIHSLYGGSVKADNASKILSIPHVSGVLVGGASLDAAQFTSIIEISKLVREKQTNAKK